MSLEAIKLRLRRHASRKKAAVTQRFFKTGPGEYGEGDIFIGVTMPDLREIAKDFSDVADRTVTRLLKSKIHEERQLALLIFVYQFEDGDSKTRKKIYDVYMNNTRHINNWDLVDISAHKIVGAWLKDRSRQPLYKFAKSTSLWERRIAIISTFSFIRKNDFSDTLKISEALIADEHDLIHKAVGWMLRELGKRDLAVEEKFLKKHYKNMPRTMLRYAIEKFPETRRKSYLKGKI